MPVHSPLQRGVFEVAVLLLAALAPARAAAPDERWANARQEFVSAYAAAGMAQVAPEDSAALQDYPLYPYLQAARLRTGFGSPARGADEGADARAADFVARYADQPVGRALRRDWLSSLAARERWDWFLAQYTEEGADTELRCQQLRARIALGRSEGLVADLRREWLNAQNATQNGPAACERAFDWLRTQQQLTPALIEQRARLALAAGNAALARRLADALPPPSAALLRQWAALISSPQVEIDALIADPDKPVESAALADGWMRLCRSDPDSALRLYPALLQARKLDAPAAASPYARALALGLAWSRRSEALDYFARVAPADLDAIAAEWQLRAALWAGDWARAAQALPALPESARAQTRWRYWSARLAEKQGDAQAARARYAELVADDNYHAALASARLDRAYAPHPQPLVLDNAAQAQLAQQPGLVRAHELWLCRLPNEAGVEWQRAFEALDAQSRLQAVGLAWRWGWYEQAIAAAARQAVFDDYELLYPRPYDVPVRVGVALSGVAEDLIYGLLRQESLYRPDALSRAGARGLMQLMPDTARRTAQRFQRPQPEPDALFDPQVNVPLGAAHLREMLDRFSGQLPVAIAAYNAGPNAAARWLPQASVDSDVWIENIPFNETRSYVQRVLWHSLVFAWRRTGKAQALDSWLGIVAPAGPPADSRS